jgi:hypothetical protein
VSFFGTSFDQKMRQRSLFRVKTPPWAARRARTSVAKESTTSSRRKAAPSRRWPMHLRMSTRHVCGGSSWSGCGSQRAGLCDVPMARSGAEGRPLTPGGVPVRRGHRGGCG